jgi:hypothetical protein
MGKGKMAESGTPKKSQADKADAYIVAHPHLVNEHWTIDQINAHADAAIKYYTSNYTEPYLSTYFAEQKIPRRSYSRWPERSEYFAAAWALLHDLQTDRLGKWLMSKDNSTAGIIFAMKNCTGWRDNPPTEDEDEEFTLINNWPDADKTD